MKVLRKFNKVMTFVLFLSILSSALSPSMLKAADPEVPVVLNIGGQQNPVQANPAQPANLPENGVNENNSANKENNSQGKKAIFDDKTLGFLKKTAIIAVPVLASIPLIGYLFKDSFKSKKFSLLNLINRKNIFGSGIITGGIALVIGLLWKFVFKREATDTAGTIIKNVIDEHKATASKVISDAGTKFVNDNIDKLPKLLNDNKENIVDITSKIVVNAMNAPATPGENVFIRDNAKIISGISKDIVNGAVDNLVNKHSDKINQVLTQNKEVVKDVLANAVTKVIDDNKDKLPEIIEANKDKVTEVLANTVTKIIDDNKDKGAELISKLLNDNREYIKDLLSDILLPGWYRGKKKAEPVLVNQENNLSNNVKDKVINAFNTAKVGVSNFIKDFKAGAEKIRVRQALDFDKIEEKVQQRIDDESKVEPVMQKQEIVKPEVKEVEIKKEEKKSGIINWAKNCWLAKKLGFGDKQDSVIVQEVSKTPEEPKTVEPMKKPVKWNGGACELIEIEEKPVVAPVVKPMNEVVALVAPKKEPVKSEVVENVSIGTEIFGEIEKKVENKIDKLEVEKVEKEILQQMNKTKVKLNEDRNKEELQKKLDKISQNEQERKKSIADAVSKNDLEKEVNKYKNNVKETGFDYLNENKVQPKIDKKEQQKEKIEELDVTKPVVEEAKLEVEKKEEIKKGFFSGFFSWINPFKMFNKTEEKKSEKLDKQEKEDIKNSKEWIAARANGRYKNERRKKAKKSTLDLSSIYTVQKEVNQSNNEQSQKPVKNDKVSSYITEHLSKNELKKIEQQEKKDKNKNEKLLKQVEEDKTKNIVSLSENLEKTIKEDLVNNQEFETSSPDDEDDDQKIDSKFKEDEEKKFENCLD